MFVLTFRINVHHTNVHYLEYSNIQQYSLGILFKIYFIFQTRNYAGHRVCAVVLRTGFCTVKGKLVRSIMFPAPVDFKFEKDSYKFVGLLTIIAGIGFTYTCVRLVRFTLI